MKVVLVMAFGLLARNRLRIGLLSSQWFLVWLVQSMSIDHNDYKYMKSGLHLIAIFLVFLF